MAASGDRSTTQGRLGCLGAGGLGLAAFFVVFSTLASQVPSCDLAFESSPPGSRSEHLAVTVTPRTGLTGGQVVRVRSTAFEARTVVGVAVCLRKASTEHRGLDACDTASASRYAVAPDGRLDAHFAVPRTITVDRRTYDCAARARRCIVVAAKVHDDDRSGGQTIVFRTGEPPVAPTPTPARVATRRLPIAGSPSGPVPAGTDVAVLATGFEPGEPIAIAWCSDELERTSSVARACEVPDQETFAAIAFSILDGVTLVADAQGRVRVTAEARASIRPFDAGSLTARPGGGASPSTATDRASRIDCRARAGRCSIVVAAVADTQRSAVLPYELAPG